MNQPNTFVVRFTNRTAIQRFCEAKDCVDEALEDAPWSDALKRAKECLDEAWDGLSFSAEKE